MVRNAGEVLERAGEGSSTEAMRPGGTLSFLGLAMVIEGVMLILAVVVVALFVFLRYEPEERRALFEEPFFQVYLVERLLLWPILAGLCLAVGLGLNRRRNWAIVAGALLSVAAASVSLWTARETLDTLWYWVGRLGQFPAIALMLLVIQAAVLASVPAHASVAYLLYDESRLGVDARVEDATRRMSIGRFLGATALGLLLLAGTIRAVRDGLSTAASWWFAGA